VGHVSFWREVAGPTSFWRGLVGYVAAFSRQNRVGRFPHARRGLGRGVTRVIRERPPFMRMHIQALRATQGKTQQYRLRSVAWVAVLETNGTLTKEEGRVQTLCGLP